ncbi:hypothetical protein PBY51_010995 [Eleginops maclovinus]|uniref:Uncharacterized protein n=1 Tax=Eleginops maclovinus TaxID=56733 RepID=A0AAN7XBP7_ELEMC|nr:hypothetical protein PBY51_010995 [Eleginops maclovinus]
MLASPTSSFLESADRGTEEEKVLVVESGCCDAAASAPCVTLSVSLINEPPPPCSHESLSQGQHRSIHNERSLRRSPFTTAAGSLETSGD